MSEYKSLLNEGETLSRVERYEVGRQEGRILIDLHQVLEGSDTKFVAMPYLVFVGRAKQEYYGYGETKDSALRDCLAKIKTASYNDVTDIDSEATKC